MTIFPMRNGIRMIHIGQRPQTLRAKCADSAEKLWGDGWTANALMRYTQNGIIKAA